MAAPEMRRHGRPGLVGRVWERTPAHASHQARPAGLSPACSHQGSHGWCDHDRTELAIYGAERRCGEGGGRLSAEPAQARTRLCALRASSRE